MKKITAVLMLTVMVPVVSAAPVARHVVSRELIQQRLAASAATRSQDVALVQELLGRPQARRIASALGADLASVRAAVPALSDDELRDLARRAAALQTDPVAGLDHDIQQLLIIFLIVAIVVLVLEAVD